MLIFLQPTHCNITIIDKSAVIFHLKAAIVDEHTQIPVLNTSKSINQVIVDRLTK